LFFDSFVDVHDENGDVAKAASSRTEVRERGVSGRVNQKDSGDLGFELEVFVDFRQVLLEIF
jgi:hypothetical protein